MSPAARSCLAALAAGALLACSEAGVEAPDPRGGGAPANFSFGVPDGGSAAAPGAGGAAGAVAGGMHCGLQRFELERLPPELLLVFDRSSSMNAMVPGTSNTRYTETSAALGDVLLETQARVLWGLKLFPSGASCSVREGVEVPLAAQNHAAVMQAIVANRPGGITGTPTALAVQQAADYLRRRTTRNPKYIVLATDGEPECGARADDLAVQAIGQAKAAGFPTFVVGIATQGTSANAVLDAMAVVGGQPRTGGTRYYPVANKSDLIGSLGQITTQVSSCVFPLDQQPPSPDDVAVKVDGVRVERDPASGWSYGAAMRTIELHGAACERLKGGQVRDVSITFGCPGVVIE